MAQQFDICIYGASETVDRNREALIRLDDSEAEAAKEFGQVCREEAEAFRRSVDAMREQYERSRLLHERAEQAESKTYSRLSAAQQNTGEACSMADHARNMLQLVQSERRAVESKLESACGRLSNALWEKENAERDIEYENSFIAGHENTRDRYREELRHCRETGNADGITNAEDYVRKSSSAIADIHEKTASIRRERLDPAKAEIAEASGLKAALEGALGELSGLEGQIAAFLSRAEQNLAPARQNEAEAQELVRRGGELRSACKDAHMEDSGRLSDLKAQSKASEEALSALSETVSTLQNEDHEAMQYTAGVLSKLSGQMLQYTTYSLEG